MTTTQSDDNTSAPPPNSKELLRPTRYEHARSWLVALLFLITVANVGLFIVWLSTFDFRQQDGPTIPNTPTSFPLETGGPMEMARPDLGELSDLTLEPTLNDELLNRLQQETSGIAVSVPLHGSEFPGEGDGDETGNGGDGRGPGPDMIPHWDRWEMKFDNTSRKRYARQLDYFKIELGVIGGSPLVDYARDLSRATPKTRRGKSTDEKRIYMTWRRGNLVRFDEQLLRAADIPTKKRIVLHFLSDELTETLLKLEDAYTDRPMEEWEKTVFTLRQKGDKYEWRVSEQTYRK